MNLFNWKLKKEELNIQIEKYDALKWDKSYRKISAILVWISVIITILLATFTSLINGYAVIVVLLVYLPISIFIYRGQRWALWTAIIIWTLDKFYMFFNGGGVIHLIWWAVYMSAFVGALQIENTRARLKKSTGPKNSNSVINQDTVKFCSQCGEKMANEGQQFCTKCGTKLSS